MEFRTAAHRVGYRARLLPLALLFLVAPCLTFADEAAEDGSGSGADPDAVHIPEPLVFDLVRELGAKRGELEVNVLGVFPLNDRSHRAIEWAPEIEYALFDGFALELELPFEDDELEGVKFAAQYTFGTAFGNHFIHGTQAIAEYEDDHDLWQLTLLYLPGFRFDEVWSTLWMLGFRTEAGDDTGNDTELILNANLFADVAPSLSVGIEVDYASGRDEDESLLLLPQVHWQLSDHFTIQAGVGLGIVDDETAGTAALRVIFEF